MNDNVAKSRKESNVVDLHEHMATCLKCEGSVFNIYVESPRTGERGSSKIIGVGCLNCGNRMEWGK